MISFSIIVSCLFVSLLLVIECIRYASVGIVSNVIIIVLFDGENISFEASLVVSTQPLTYMSTRNTSWG
jgi:hypothetical protein